tara:strand:+ start:300 stop:995 length:696 start_codon:yes stop_codon:yes gene_type:complete
MNKKVIVDIGCFNARTLSLANKLLHRKREKWFGLMVEPNIHLKEEIFKSLSGCDFKYEHCAISNEDGVGKLYMGKYGFMNRRSPAQKEKCMRSSLLKDTEYISQHLTDEYQTVPLKTLDTLFKEHNITHVDILKIDTEGNDKNILSAYSWQVFPEEIITEDYVAIKGNTTKEYREEQEEIKQRKWELLRSKGYLLKWTERVANKKGSLPKLIEPNSCWIRKDVADARNMGS